MTFIRIAFFLLAVLSFYIATLSEGQDNTVKNYFSKFWEVLNNQSTTFAGKIDQLITQFTSGLVAAIERYFGTKLFSFKAFFCSACLSTTSFGLVLLLICVLPLSKATFGWDWTSFLMIFTPIILAFYFTGYEQLANKPLGVKLILCLIPFGFIYAFFNIFAGSDFNDSKSFVTLNLTMLGWLSSMIISDFLYISMCRFVFARIISAKSTLAKVGLVVLNTSFIAIVLFPLTTVSLLFYQNGKTPDPSLMPFTFGTFLIPASSLFAIFLSLAHVLIVLLYFVNAILWETLEHPILYLKEKGLLKHNGFFFALGVIFFGLFNPSLQNHINQIKAFFK